MKLLPQGNWVHLSLLPQDDTAKSRLIVSPGHDRDQLRHAKVLAIGPDVLDLCVGDTVVTSYLAGIRVGDDAYLVRESAVVGLVEQ